MIASFLTLLHFANATPSPSTEKARFDQRRSRAFFCLRSGRSISTSYIPGIAMFLHPFSMDYGILAQHDARPLFVWLVTSSRQRSESQHLKQIVEKNTHTHGF